MGVVGTGCAKAKTRRCQQRAHFPFLTTAASAHQHNDTELIRGSNTASRGWIGGVR